MRLLIAIILCMVQASVALGQTTAEQLRDWAFAGDLDAMERRFALAHSQSVNDDLSYEALRELTGGVAVSHPSVVHTIDAWLEALPDSPYANTIRAMQYADIAWSVRGTALAKDTPREALRTFSEFQDLAMELSIRAYQAAPDFVPASDMLIRTQIVTNYYDDVAFFDLILTDIMQKTPNIPTLKLSGGLAARIWGGRGALDVELICTAHAKRIPDPTFDTDVCRVLLTSRWGTSAEQTLSWAALGNRYHPALDPERAWDLTSPLDRTRTEAEIEFVEAYLLGEGRGDVKVVEGYHWQFGNSPSYNAISLDVARHAQAQARETLIDDPYNLSALNVLLGEDSDLRVFDPQHNLQNIPILKARKAVAMPFHAAVWQDIASVYASSLDDIMSNRAMPYYQNALYYSDHDVHVLGDVLFYAVRTLEISHLVARPDDPQIKVTQSTPEEFVCQFVRLDRIATHQCGVLGLEQSSCPEVKLLIPEYDRYLSEALATGICPAEANASMAALRYRQAEVLLEELAKPLVWD